MEESCNNPTLLISVSLSCIYRFLVRLIATGRGYLVASVIVESKVA